MKLFPETFNWGGKTLWWCVVLYHSLAFSWFCLNTRIHFFCFLTEKKYNQPPQALPTTDIHIFPPCSSHHNGHNLKTEPKHIINTKISTEKWNYCHDQFVDVGFRSSEPYSWKSIRNVGDWVTKSTGCY